MLENRNLRFKKEIAIFSSLQSKKFILIWNKIEPEITVEKICVKHDKNKKNALLVICKKIVYLNFISTCKNRLSKKVEKSNEYFAIFYQGLLLSNYVGKTTMYIVACFRQL